MKREKLQRLLGRLYDAQKKMTEIVSQNTSTENLDDKLTEEFTMLDVLRLWGFHYRSHLREIVMARGRLIDDNAHFHIPHFIRETNEEFGRFIGELAALDDEKLEMEGPAGKSIEQIAEHVLGALESWFPSVLDK